ncbi:MAG: hypothetical protein IJZ80_05580, partial [Clostridia bacterium]|nr:hypothetical protein [Clostridia bacterium]
MKTKKIIALLLCIAIMLATLPLLCFGTSAVEVQTQTDLSEQSDGASVTVDGVNYTVIKTVAYLNSLGTLNGNYILGADLNYGSNTAFQTIKLTGIFNGNGHAITVADTLALQSHDVWGMGMFAPAHGDNAGELTILNLTVGSKDYPIKVTDGGQKWETNGVHRLGTLIAFTGKNSTTTVENVTVYGQVRAGSDFRVGGIIGEARGTLTMRNCVFNGTLAVNGTTSSHTKHSVAGLVANTWNCNLTVENCATYGTFTYEVGGGCAGGLAGQLDHNTEPSVFKNCANYATVIGGVCGGLVGASGNYSDINAPITMENCFNAGEVTGTIVAGTTVAGGLIGTTSASQNTTLTQCANIGSVNNGAGTWIATPGKAATITNCKVLGSFNNRDDAAEALEWMQTNCSFAMFGVEKNRIVVKDVPAEAKYLQYKKDSTANTMDIRVLGAVNASDLSKYANVGFNVSVYDANGAAPVLLKKIDPQITTTVYESVKANESGTITTYSAKDLGAAYLYALELQGIPMSGSYVFKITAFATEAKDDTTISDFEVAVKVVEGDIVDNGSFTINGNRVSISGYEIIYPENGTLFEKQMAMRLQSYLLDKTGYELTLKDDGEARATERAFLIGKTKYSTELISGTLSTGQGCVNSTGSDIVAWGNDMTGTVNACKKLTELLFNTESGMLEQNVSIDSAIVATGKSGFSTMSFNVKTYDQTPERNSRVINVLLRYMPDSIGLQEVDQDTQDNWMPVLKGALSDYYEFVGEGREGGNKGDAVPILYAKEKYNLIEYGTKWLSDTPDVASKLEGA